MGRDIARQSATVPANRVASPVDKFADAVAGNLDAAQKRAITSLLTGATATAAAKAANVHRGTVHRWMKEDPAFIAEFNLARKEMSEAVGQELRYLASEAIDVLRSFLVDPDIAPPLRLKAAIEVLKASSPLPDEPTDVEDVQAAITKRDVISARRKITAKMGL